MRNKKQKTNRVKVGSQETVQSRTEDLGGGLETIHFQTRLLAYSLADQSSGGWLGDLPFKGSCSVHLDPPGPRQNRREEIPVNAVEPGVKATGEAMATGDQATGEALDAGESPVSLQFDLNNLFQLDKLVLNFKGPRPQSLVIERSMDNSGMWEPALYLATDCQKAFPGVPTTIPLTLDQTYCHTLSHHSDLYKDERIEFSPLRQYLSVPAPNSQKLEEKSGFMGLRVRLIELGEVPHIPGRSLSRFYALQEVRVMGSCLCHGHANRCLPEKHNDPLSNTIQMNPQCDCKHNTAGVNCENCAELYNDLPWRPAEEGHTHTCKRNITSTCLHQSK
ncbi:laminin subunit beta-3-like [Nematolebias whitei]|uniref:laminin subunit beta-3-like n=1 Tax=Nematolebias whitei TaxID=451745 RepID=UPI001898C546|nr:laminin subunit beta-3-like [Nematolebias whitei]